jgi:hypothetical protein
MADRLIVPGLSISLSGQATIDRSLNNVLFDLALQLEEPTNRPVDVQHVVAAIVFASESGQINADLTPSAADPKLIEILTPYVKMIFDRYGGEVSNDD